MNKVDIESGIHFQPKETEKKAPNQDVPGTGIKAWLLRAYYFIRLYLLSPAWFFNQLFSKHNSFGEKQIPKRTGDVAVVTGGARGIGTEIVKKLLIADINVIIGCRDLVAGYELIQRLRLEGVNTGTAECLFLDLECLDSVRAFARRVLQKYPALHILINNAGIMIVPFRLTDDGFESQFQVNYLGHLLLSVLLIPALANGGSENKFSRIINVSSKGQDRGEINFDDLLTRKMYSRTHAYNCTKLMQVVSSNFLDEQFKEKGLKIHSHAVHPGLIYTELFKHQILFKLLRPIFKILMMTIEQGADGIVFAALSPKIETFGGLFLLNCQPLPQHLQAIDKNIQRRLWDVSCDLIKVDKNILERSNEKNSIKF